MDTLTGPTGTTGVTEPSGRTELINYKIGDIIQNNNNKSITPFLI
jgi:hypothetical protein